MYPWNENKYVLFDGGMGTQLNQRIQEQILPEEANLRYPEVLEQIQREYAQAGAQILTTNTFGANHFKLKKVGLEPEEVIKAGVEIARKAAGDKMVALDVGPLGIMLEPNGELEFEEAYEAFKRQMVAGERAGCDLVLIETMTDLQEARCAILAAKENTNLPVFCTMTFGEQGRTLLGNDPGSMVAALEGLGADVIGVNCSLGPDKLLGVVEEILGYANIPVMVQPNAGMPVYRDGKTCYDISKEHFAQVLAKMADMGVKVLGGCCGTDASYIRLVKESLEGKTPADRPAKDRTLISSHRKCIVMDDQVTVVSENVLPHGNKEVMEAFMEEDFAEIAGLVREAGSDGAHLVDVRTAGLPGKDEKSMMVELVENVQMFSDVPLMLESRNPEVLEAALRIYAGKAVINGLDGRKRTMEALFPVAKKFGAAVLALTLDEEGVPADWKRRVEIAEKILKEAHRHGIATEDVIFDPVVLPVATGEDLLAPLKAAAAIKEELGAKVLHGIGNVSYKMPKRKLLNRTYLAMAMAWGMDGLLMDVEDEESWHSLKAAAALAGKDLGGMDYALSMAGFPEPKDGLDETADWVYRGLMEGGKDLQMKQTSIQEGLIAAENAYRSGEILLPNLRRSVESAKRLMAHLNDQGAGTKGTIVFSGGPNHMDVEMAVALARTLGYGTKKWQDGRIEGPVAGVAVEVPFITTSLALEKMLSPLQEAFPDTPVILIGPGANRVDWKDKGLAGAATSAQEWLEALEVI